MGGGHWAGVVRISRVYRIYMIWDGIYLNIQN